MKVIVDRFEGNYAVVELPDRTMVNIDRRLLPGVKEGDVVVIDIKINPEKTEKRKAQIKKLADDLWE